ncbi:pilus assembly protein TadG-related protein [Parasedimentitalea psychrophila]|uniref:Pilus assembly protein TadG-related protein n=1 Tax=Parasedimentitalea psychrophila TaxID=2997337 RepID=A0A9Y2P2I1_9RHOB|nr:pilus assembly protein TadG-related protein [Parasedimentitalea psychrophila]WIY25097.1 pilus assembly protein TadG-related protein [Parasedimentitalea psychrophila]
MMIRKTLIAFARDTSGVAMAYSLMVLMVLLIAAGFAIDSANVIYTRARLQNAADAAALAGAALIPENTGSITADVRADILAEAVLFAQKNMTTTDHGDVLVQVDVILGFWDSDGALGAPRSFYPEGSPGIAMLNSVATTTRKSSANDNAQPMFLIGMVAADTLDISVSAIAIAPPPSEGKDCMSAGFFALGTAEGGSTNELRDGWCIHGEEGVKFGSQNSIEGGPDAETQSTISMPSPSSNYGEGGFDFGSDNEVVPEEFFDDGSWANNDLPDIVETATIADYLNPAIDFMFDISKPAGHSDHIHAAQDMVDILYDDYPGGYPPGISTIIYSSDNVDIDYNFNNALIVSDKKITIGSDVTMNNVFLLAKENVEIGSNVTIGSSTYCDSPDNSMNFILGAEMAKFGSDVEMFNLQVFAGDYVDWGSNNATVGAVSVFSAGSLKFGSDWDIRGCGGANLLLNYSNTPVSEPLRLVQ